MHRRDFIKMTATLGIAGALPLWSHKILAAQMQGISQDLPIPSLLYPDESGKIRLSVKPGSMPWSPSAVTPTWGINGPVLGPAIRLERGKNVTIIVDNGLPEATTLHWHGLEVPGTADGGPQALIQPQEQWQAQFLVDQPAATCWFHPHLHQSTGRQVAMGLGGLLLINDQESAQLHLPRSWGHDDIPVILQDKRLLPDGKIDYQLDVMTAAVGWFGDMMLTNGVVRPKHNAPLGWLRLRFLNACNARSLNLATSDNRPMYVIAGDGGFLPEPVKVSELSMFMGERFEVMIDCSDGKAFDIVTLPVRQMGMTLAPFDQPLSVLRLNPVINAGEKKMPDQLVKATPLPATDGLPTRMLKLTMDPRLDMEGMQELMRRHGEKAMAGMSMDDHGGMDMAHNADAAKTSGGADQMAGMDHGNMNMGAARDKDAGHDAMDHGTMENTPDPNKDANKFDLLHSNFINGQSFDMMKPAFDVKQGQYEKWTISGKGDKMLHPFHIHGTQFRILSENGKTPAPHRSGWKDTVQVEDGESEVLVRFAHLAPPERMYMAHCHLLEHEDTGMMLGFTVSK